MQHTTRAERLIIDRVMDGIMSDVATAAHSLYDVWDLNFGNCEQGDILADDAARIGRIVYMCMDMLTRAVSEYNFELGRNDAATTSQRKNAKERADRAELVAAVESVVQAAHARGQYDLVSAAADMSDEKAIEYLKASLERKEPNTQA